MTESSLRTGRSPSLLWRGALALLLAASAAHGQSGGSTREEALVRFQRGVTLYNEGDFRAALIEFKRAYEVAPNYRVLFNLGQSSMELQDYAAALRFFESYLSEGGKEIPPDRRTVAEAEVKKLQSRVARLTVKVNLDGAEVLIDDVSVGVSPLKEPVLVSAGRRKVSAQRAGIPAMSRIVDLAGGDRLDVSLELAAARPAPTTPASAAPPPSVSAAPLPPPPPEKHLGAPFWISLGTTAALLGTTTVTGLLAVSAHSTFNNDIQTRGVSHDEVESARSRNKTLALVTDVLGGLTLVGAGLTTYFALSASPPKADQASLQVRLSPSGVSLLGSFLAGDYPVRASPGRPPTPGAARPRWGAAARETRCARGWGWRADRPGASGWRPRGRARAARTAAAGSARPAARR
jgi:hypothetical protein